jgi:chemotaxis protein methyltransferase CheR
MTTLRASNQNSGASQRIPLAARTTIAPRLFEKYQALIYEAAGIWLSNAKTALLCGRLARRLRSLELETMEEYFDFVTHPDNKEEFVRMLDAITTNETHFFREPKHFEFMVQRLFPRWKREAEEGTRPRKIRVWSAACSSGEEPYSLAMLLLKHFPASEGWTLEIVATDISTQVLDKAKAGVYVIDKARDIPHDLLQRFMLQGTGEHEGRMKVGLEAQEIVRFSRLNLNEDPLAVQGIFDAIFCRNVLIYFDMESKTRVVNGLMRHLSHNGLLFVGHSENLAGVTNKMKTLAPTIYGNVDEQGRLVYDFRRTERAHADTSL